MRYKHGCSIVTFSLNESAYLVIVLRSHNYLIDVKWYIVQRNFDNCLGYYQALKQKINLFRLPLLRLLRFPLLFLLSRFDLFSLKHFVKLVFSAKNHFRFVDIDSAKVLLLCFVKLALFRNFLRHEVCYCTALLVEPCNLENV